MRTAAGTPLAEVVKIHEYFGDPAHAPMLQVADDKTLFAWQNMSAFEPTVQVPRDGPVSELREAGDASIGKGRVHRPRAARRRRWRTTSRTAPWTLCSP